MDRKNGSEFQNSVLVKVMKSLMDLIVQILGVFNEVNFNESLKHEYIRVMGITESKK